MTHRHRAIIALYLIVLVAPNSLPASAQQPFPQARTMTVEDVLALRSVDEVAISPDGKWVAYVVSERDLEENTNRSVIWIVATDGGEPMQLTRGPRVDRSPQWAADASWLAFLSERGEDGKPQVYGIRPHGGEAWRVTEWEPGVESFRLSPSGDRIALIATASATEADKTLEKRRSRPVVRDSVYGTEWSRLWIASVNGGAAADPVQISPDSMHVTKVLWAPNAESVAWSARPSPNLRTSRHSAVYVQERRGAAIRQVTAMPGGEDVEAWTEELGLVVSGTGQELGTYNQRLWRIPAAEGAPIPLTDSFDEHASLVVATATALYLEATAGTGRGLFRLRLRGGQPAGPAERVSGDAMFASGFSITPDGKRVAFVGETPEQAPDVYAGSTATFQPRRLTRINPQVADLALGEQRVVRWRSEADGEEIEGVLTLPVGYSEQEPVPLLLVIHGGPSGVSSNRFVASRGAYPVQVFAGLGYAVLQPNYRGSTGYGERFRALNRGDISGRDWIDVNSGVDHLIEQGIADSERLGIMGWSFGGHHTYWAITQTDRYKAASAGAGAVDLISMYSQTDLPEFYHTYLGPSPWENFGLYEERSAYRFVERVVTPLLIQVGEADKRVPAEQSIQFYEAMKGIGKAPVKLVLYPGQPHGIRDPLLQRDLMERNVDWFTRWIPIRGKAAAATGSF